MNKLLVSIKKLIPTKLFKAMQPAYHFVFSWLAAFLFGFPSEKLIVIGITGTTGKTTTAYLLLKILQDNGFKAGLTSTAIFNDGEKEWLNDKKMTMVGRFFTQGMLKKMVKNGCQFAIIETTSEGVRQFRHRFINYDWLGFTGLYPEHIESHGSFENYKEAKGKLFAHLKNCQVKYADDNFKIEHHKSGLKKIELNRVKKTIVANLDDKEAPYFLSFWAEHKIGFKLDNSPLGRGAESKRGREGLEDLPENIEVIKYGQIESNQKGVCFNVLEKNIKLCLLGEFNSANAMMAICLARLVIKDISKIGSAISKINGVAGRMEKIEAGQSFTVIVDYAFEPNALAKLYEAVKNIPHQKIINVLGSTGGGRDIARRPKLGVIAGREADLVIVTNEDPYDDDPQLIIDQVSAGAENAGKKLNENLFNILDRREAIKKALSLANEGDIVLITGKGNEQAICVANEQKIPWDDRQVAREEIEKMLKAK